MIGKNWNKYIFLVASVMFSLYFLYVLQVTQSSQIVFYNIIVSKLKVFSTYIAVDKTGLILFPAFLSLFLKTRLSVFIKLVISTIIFLFVKNDIVLFCAPLYIVCLQDRKDTRLLMQIFKGYVFVMSGLFLGIEISILLATMLLLYLLMGQRNIIIELIFLYFLQTFYSQTFQVTEFLIPIFSLVILFNVLVRKVFYLSSFVYLLLFLLNLDVSVIVLFFLILNLISDEENFILVEYKQFLKIITYILALFVTRQWLEVQFLIAGVLVLEVLNSKGAEYAK